MFCVFKFFVTTANKCTYLLIFECLNGSNIPPNIHSYCLLINVKQASYLMLACVSFQPMKCHEEIANAWVCNASRRDLCRLQILIHSRKCLWACTKMSNESIDICCITNFLAFGVEADYFKTECMPITRRN
jgi:hypothetical protein